MGKKIIKKRIRTHKFSKSRKRIKAKKYKAEKGYLKKLFLLIILLILYLTIISKKNDDINHKENKEKPIKIYIREKIETIIPSKLSLSEHYKLILPKIKYHKIKKIDPNKEINLFKLENSVDYKKMKAAKNREYIYHSCIIAKAKNENLYVREFIEHYLNIGVEKFYFGDDNEEFVENLSDVLDDYIKKGIVEIEYIKNLHLSHHDFCEYAFKAVKLRCKWILIFDIDEFLEFTNKSMTLKTYLDTPMFDKCDVIRIHWLIYDDNNLTYYDNRPLKERFTHALPHHNLNIYHKSIVRGKDYGVNMFSEQKTAHQPTMLVSEQCGAIGNFEKLGKDIMMPPHFELCHLRHHTFKTAEEFALKMLRGDSGANKYDFDFIMGAFAGVNEITEEKLKVIEHIANKTFPKYHKNNNRI